MRMEIFKAPVVKEPVLLLKLAKYATDIVLIAVDELGNSIVAGQILRISAEGITVNSSVNADVPLPKDSCGRVRVRKEGE